MFAMVKFVVGDVVQIGLDVVLHFTPHLKVTFSTTRDVHLGESYHWLFYEILTFRNEVSLQGLVDVADAESSYGKEGLV